MARYLPKKRRNSKPGKPAFRQQVAPTDCVKCKLPAHEHQRVKVYPDDGPAGTYHYELHCPG